LVILIQKVFFFSEIKILNVSHLAGPASISTHITLDWYLCRSRLGNWCTTPSQLNKTIPIYQSIQV